MRKFLIGIVIGALICMLLMEGLFRFAPVSSGARMLDTNAEMPISRYPPNMRYTYSFGWTMANAQRGVTNRLGFTHSLSRVPPGGILIVGDSFIESLMLDYADTVQGRLEAIYPGKVEAISASGDSLADTLKIVELYTPATRPSVVVVFIDDTDFRGLLQDASPGHNRFVVAGDGVSVVHNPYTESSIKVLAGHSALVRYVYYNLKFPQWLLSLRTAPAKVGMGDELTDRSRRHEVMEYYMSRLRSLADAGGFRVMFLVDGDREAIYADRLGKMAANGEVDRQRQAFMQLARQHGLGVIDMQPVFLQYWKTNRERLDWLPMDGHWNAVAHFLASEQLRGRVGYLR